MVRVRKICNIHVTSRNNKKRLDFGCYSILSSSSTCFTVHDQASTRYEYKFYRTPTTDLLYRAKLLEQTFKFEV